MRIDKKNNAFTLIELLVVIAVIALLLGVLMPTLNKAKHLVAEKICSSNLRQVNLALATYANDNRELFPLEPTEHNPHPEMLQKIKAYDDDGLMKAFYCPRDNMLEEFASNTDEYIPLGAADSVVDTPENRQRGNVSYVYWSFVENKYFEETPWRNPKFFIPRQLKTTGVQWLYTDRPTPSAPLAKRWVTTDFFRRGAPFPHTRGHAKGLNITFLDGHVELIKGKPKLNYR